MMRKELLKEVQLVNQNKKEIFHLDILKDIWEILKEYRVKALQSL